MPDFSAAITVSLNGLMKGLCKEKNGWSDSQETDEDIAISDGRSCDLTVLD